MESLFIDVVCGLIITVLRIAAEIKAMAIKWFLEEGFAEKMLFSMFVGSFVTMMVLCRTMF